MSLDHPKLRVTGRLLESWYPRTAKLTHSDQPHIGDGTIVEACSIPVSKSYSYVDFNITISSLERGVGASCGATLHHLAGAMHSKDIEGQPVSRNHILDPEEVQRYKKRILKHSLNAIRSHPVAGADVDLQQAGLDKVCARVETTTRAQSRDKLYSASFAPVMLYNPCPAESDAIPQWEGLATTTGLARASRSARSSAAQYRLHHC